MITSELDFELKTRKKNTPESKVLVQLYEILVQLDLGQYTASLSVLNNSSIGQHARHVIEFYQCLLSGVKVGTVDYDARKRHLLLENDLNFTLNSIEGIIAEIETMAHCFLPLQLAVVYDDENQSFVETNFQREMVYMIEHSIHHYALIRIGIQENFKGIDIPKNFGVAYSTVKHLSETKS